MSSNSKKKSLNFESTLNEIEKIIESLEEGNLSLEDSIEAYEKGISLTKACQKMLSDAELKIKKLSSKEGEDVSFEDISNDWWFLFSEKKSKKKALISTTKIRNTEVNIASEAELLILKIFFPNIVMFKY